MQRSLLSGQCDPSPREAMTGRAGRRGHVLARGPTEAPAVLLIHGLASFGAEMWTPLADRLAAAGLKVLAIDRPGYGSSDPAPPSQMGPAAQARWLAELLRGLGVRPALLVAHSFGAAVALHLASRLSGLRGLVLINPFCRPADPALAPLLRLAVAPLVGRAVREHAIPAVAGPLVRTCLGRACAPDPTAPSLRSLPIHVFVRASAWMAMAAELRAFNADMAAFAPDGATAPTIVLTGAQDRVIPALLHARWLETRLPRIAHRTLDGGHLLHHAHPAEVTSAAVELLRCESGA